MEVTNGNGKLDAVVTYDGGSLTPPTFTNKYSTSLPFTGGAGMTATYLVGAALLIIAGIRVLLYRTGAKKGGVRRD